MPSPFRFALNLEHTLKAAELYGLSAINLNQLISEIIIHRLRVLRFFGGVIGEPVSVSTADFAIVVYLQL